MAKYFVKIAWGTTFEELESEINDMLDEGFELYGNMVADLNGMYSQAMTKDVEDDSNAGKAYEDYQNSYSDVVVGGPIKPEIVDGPPFGEIKQVYPPTVPMKTKEDEDDSKKGKKGPKK